MTSERFFCSKILLFGEYSIIKNSMALAAPYHVFEGRLVFPTACGNSVAVDSELMAFSEYLIRLSENGMVGDEIDVTSFNFDVGQGMFFESTIPRGFGIGSSGALVASVFSKYANPNFEFENITKLKSIFSKLESHFHGASSGVDPLISFLNAPIKILEDGANEVTTIPDYNSGKGGIFLLNTRRARRTEPLVNLFLEKCKSKEFNDLCKEMLLPITNNCINSFIEKDIDALYSNFKELSDFQYRNYSPMIPKLFRDVWRKGIASDNYFLKLCGAGGGGFLLGITRDFKSTVSELSQHELKIIYKFE